MSRPDARERWVVEFRDGGHWNVLANSERRHKAEACALADLLNRRTSHSERGGSFGGRRYRVRKRRESA